MKKILMVITEGGYMMPVSSKIPKRWTYFIEIGSYLRKLNNEVKFMDCLESSVSHGEILKEMSITNYDVVIMLARTESVRSLIKMAHVIKKISPNTKIVVYGDIVNYAPNFFKDNLSEVADALVLSGDWDIVLGEYMEYLKNERVTLPEGITINLKSGWSEVKPRNDHSFTQWSFPEVSESINKTYLPITKNEITLTVSRGCPYECKFCPAVITFNKCDRRKDVGEVINYIEENKEKFDSFKLFSPTFTINDVWVREFCKNVIDKKLNIKWTATTRPDCFGDDELVNLMAKSGCYKMAVGIESLDKESTKKLEKYNHREYLDQVTNMYKLANKYGIEIKPLVMLGIEGQNAENINESFKLLKTLGSKEIRAAAYSPRQILQERDKEHLLEIEEIEAFDKMTYINYEIPEISTSKFLNLIYNTNNFEKII